jgi:hypothetical protein
MTLTRTMAPPILDFFPTLIYHSRNGSLLPAPSHNRSLHAPVLPTRLHPHRPIAAPLDDTPEGLRARNHAAIAKVAALLPVDANEADLAARCEENVSENETNSQKTAFETWMSAIPWNGVSKGSGKTGPRDVVREATARSCLVGRESPANGREPPERRTKAMPNIDRSTGPANTGAQCAR